MITIITRPAGKVPEKCRKVGKYYTSPNWGFWSFLAESLFKSRRGPDRSRWVPMDLDRSPSIPTVPNGSNHRTDEPADRTTDLSPTV